MRFKTAGVNSLEQNKEELTYLRMLLFSLFRCLSDVFRNTHNYSLNLSLSLIAMNQGLKFAA